MQSQKNKPKKALILSAGFGTRLKPITDTIPKALVEVGGKAMLERNLDMIKDAGFSEVIINTHYLSDRIVDFAAHYTGLSIDIIHESEILETGGGILNAMKNIAYEPLLVVNCDIILHNSDRSNPLLPLLKSWDESKMELLALLQKSDTRKGDFNLSTSGKIVNEGEDKKFIFLGAYIISPEFFKGYEVHKFRMPEIIFKAKGEDHKFFGIENHSKWIDIGSLESLKEANSFFKNT